MENLLFDSFGTFDICLGNMAEKKRSSLQNERQQNEYDPIRKSGQN